MWRSCFVGLWVVVAPWELQCLRARQAEPACPLCLGHSSLHIAVVLSPGPELHRCVGESCCEDSCWLNSSSRTEALTAGPGSVPTTSSADTDSKISRSSSAWLCVRSGFICVDIILLISRKLCLLNYMYSLYLNEFEYSSEQYIYYIVVVLWDYISSWILDIDISCLSWFKSCITVKW